MSATTPGRAIPYSVATDRVTDYPLTDKAQAERVELLLGRVLAYVEVAATTAFTAAATNVAGASITFTPIDGARRIRLFAAGALGITAAASLAEFRIMEGGTTITRWLFPTPQAGDFLAPACERIITPTAAAHTYFVQTSGVAGAPVGAPPIIIGAIDLGPV